MDYNSLVAQIRAYANRNDQIFVDQIPNFITQALVRIYSEAKNIGFQLRATNAALLEINVPYIAKPAGWRETISIQYDAGNGQMVLLLPRSYEFCLTYWPDAEAISLPQFYADFDYQTYYIVPTPRATYRGRIAYKGLPVFDAANPTNFLTDQYPSLLFYACMLEAMIFLKDDERVGVYKSYYQDSLQNINQDSAKMIGDRTANRSAN